MVLNLGGFVLLWQLRSVPLPRGGLTGVYLIYYALVRSFTSLFRADDLYLGPFRLPHVISMIMVVAGVILVVRRESAATPTPGQQGRKA
jgi:phosphatidylglycerol:prolipoprotein diacylglycerol transferase